MMVQNNEKNPVLVVGGGVAGIIAAFDLAEMGRTVHLVDSAPLLGGQVAKLDKIYPTDHCAFCPLWTDIKKVQEHHRVIVHTTSKVTDITQDADGYNVVIVCDPPAIDESLCIFCGRCVDTCTKGAVRPLWAHAYPPAYFIDRQLCAECGDCVDVCPTEAINLNRTEVELFLAVDEVIWATGFKEADLSTLPEFGMGTHPDVMTSLEFEEWIAEAGVNKGTITRKVNGAVPKNIAFIQCVGARDQRMLPYCSAVCCMHALKQAQWVKRRNPLIDCTILYTDLRTVGRGYNEYSLRELHESAITFIRGRPGLIHPLPTGDAIAIKYENTLTQTREIAKFDMVVLNGNLQTSPARKAADSQHIPPLNGEGFVDTMQDEIPRYACGFNLEPADIAESVIQASSAAMKVTIKEELQK